MAKKAERKLVLPSPVMEKIFQFCGPIEKAHLAMTCKSWQRVIYRNSVWKNYIWTPKGERFEDSKYFHLHKDARHMSHKSDLCFAHWIGFICDSVLEIPKIIHESWQNSDIVIKSLKTLWKESGCQCLILSHYNFEDIIIAPDIFRSFSKQEQLILKYSISDSPKQTRAYYRFVTHWKNYLIKMMTHMEDYGNYDESFGLSPDILRIFQKKLKDRFDNVFLTIIQYLGQVLRKYSDSSNHLSILSDTMFEENDSWSKSVDIWNLPEIQFQYISKDE